MVARLNERGGKWVLTWPRCFAVKQADTEEAGKRLVLSVVLAALPPDLLRGVRPSKASLQNQEAIARRFRARLSHGA